MSTTLLIIYIIVKLLKKCNNQYTFVELSNYNNNGFGSSLSRECKADLTFTGQYFLKDGLPNSKFWDIDNISFRFPELLDNNNDNISCENQLIELPAREYQSIILSGCA